MIVMTRLAFRELCIVSVIAEWNVGNKKKKKEDSLSGLKSIGASHADSSMTALSGLQQMNYSQAPEEVPNVLMLPTAFRVNGVVVRFPELNPPMNPVLSEQGGVLGFYTRSATHQ
jgi:hypothetical protein